MPLHLKTPQETLIALATRFKALRLAMDLTQEGLAARSGVSQSSLKRFERTGLIALDSLLRIALVLGCLDDFDKLAENNGTTLSAKSLEDILTEPKRRKKGRMK